MTTALKIYRLGNKLTHPCVNLLNNSNKSICSTTIYINRKCLINSSAGSALVTTKIHEDYSSSALNFNLINRYCSTKVQEEIKLDSAKFEKVCDETLESLCDYFEELVEASSDLKYADVTYGSGVLTIKLGNPYGTYVINRQSPNQQIWLSSPVSGPKRYDFMLEEEYWIYKHDNMPLHQLLQNEFAKIIKGNVDFSRCTYSLVKK